MIEQPTVKVIFIMGWGRSGSTVLDNVLGSLDGFFSAGELRYFWERGLLGGWKCGCGRALQDCEVWSHVIRYLQRELSAEQSDPERVVALQDRYMRVRRTPALLWRSRGSARDARFGDYLAAMGSLYSATARVTGARVIIDSSKRPSDAAALFLMPEIEPFVVHLVRDPRGVAFSWSKRDWGLVRHGVVDSTFSWLAWNLLGEALGFRVGRERSMTIKYEDFASHPGRVIRRIGDLVGEEVDVDETHDETRWRLATNHTVSGNPSRFRVGDIEIRPDVQWTQHLPRWKSASATAIGLPLLGRYEYPLVPRRPAAEPGPGGRFRRSTESN